MALDQHQRSALADMRTVGRDVSIMITHARAPLRPLTLPDDIVAKLVEAQQAIFEAQRMMEALLG